MLLGVHERDTAPRGMWAAPAAMQALLLLCVIGISQVAAFAAYSVESPTTQRPTVRRRQTPPVSTALESEVARRRNLAIISHPDAGKTTLTEKLLLYGGAIQAAGAVKAKGEQRRAASDFMQIEQDRGISISSTVMAYEYERGGDASTSVPFAVRILDTPGHQDFSEDTYRTLAAADNAVMLVDAAKGLEPQTRKLFEVARLRRLPLFTFVNKLDREARSPYELCDEIESEFGLGTCPVRSSAEHMAHSHTVHLPLGALLSPCTMRGTGALADRLGRPVQGSARPQELHRASLPQGRARQDGRGARVGAAGRRRAAFAHRGRRAVRRRA